MRRYEGYVNMPAQHQGVTSRAGAWTKSLESQQQSWSWNLEAHYLQGKILYTVRSRCRWLWKARYWHEKQIFFLLRGEIPRLTNKWQARWMEILIFLYPSCFMLHVLEKEAHIFARFSSVQQDTKPCQSCQSAFDMLLYYTFYKHSTTMPFYLLLHLYPVLSDLKLQR